MNRFAITLIIISILIPINLLYCEEYFPACDKESVYSFASELLTDKQFDKAALEFLRYKRYFPEDTLLPSVNFRLAYSYEKLTNYERARAEYLNLFSNYPENSIAGHSFYRYYLTYYLNKQMDTLRYLVEDVKDSLADQRLKTSLKYLSIWSLIDQQDFISAKEILSGLSDDNTFLKPSLNYLLSKTQQVDYLTEKSPIFSSILSTVIPGLGQGYCERWGDAGYSFILSVGGIGSGYYFWERDRNFALFTGISGLFFYLGNIYGAFSSAILYNRDTAKDYIDAIHRDVPHPPEEILKGDIDDR